MKKAIYILITLALLFPSCSSVRQLTDEERSRLIEGSVFQPEPTTTIEYIPYEVVRYVYPEEGIVKEDRNHKNQGELLEDATENSSVTVQSTADFRNAIVEYSFVDGKIYDIFTSPDHVTDIRLQPNEVISGEAAIGNANAFQLTTSASTENGTSVTHIYIRPVTTGLDTSMIIPTNQRTYYLRILSYEDLHMVGVRWNYPILYTFPSPTGGTETDASIDTGISISVENLNYNYKISGDNTVWKPVVVFDDGVHTYIQFDPRFNSSAGAPALYLLPTRSSSESKMEVVNYVIRGNLYITDFVIQDRQVWYLMSDKHSVKISRD